MAAGPPHPLPLPLLSAGRCYCCHPSPSSSLNQTSCWSRCCCCRCCCWIQTQSCGNSTTVWLSIAESIEQCLVLGAWLLGARSSTRHDNARSGLTCCCPSQSCCCCCCCCQTPSCWKSRYHCRCCCCCCCSSRSPSCCLNPSCCCCCRCCRNCRAQDGTYSWVPWQTDEASMLLPTCMIHSGAHGWLGSVQQVLAGCLTAVRLDACHCWLMRCSTCRWKTRICRAFCAFWPPCRPWPPPGASPLARAAGSCRLPPAPAAAPTGPGTAGSSARRRKHDVLRQTGGAAAEGVQNNMLRQLQHAGPIGEPSLPSTEGAMSASATIPTPVRFQRTLGCMSCWVRVGRALYTGAFLHSYVQCPVCRHRWHTTPALPPPRLGACSSIRVERRCLALQGLKAKQLPLLALVACRAVAGCCAAKAARSHWQRSHRICAELKGVDGRCSGVS